MAKNIREFINSNVKEGIIKRDIFISDSIDKAYLEPLAKVWSEYSIRKRDIIFLSIVIAHKYAVQIKKKGIDECEKVQKGGKPVDMGRLSDFNDNELTFLVTILVSKYGINEVVLNLGKIWGDLQVMAEEGIRILYCKIYKEKAIPTEIFNTIFNMDEELKI